VAEAWGLFDDVLVHFDDEKRVATEYTPERVKIRERPYTPAESAVADAVRQRGRRAENRAQIDAGVNQLIVDLTITLQDLQSLATTSSPSINQNPAQQIKRLAAAMESNTRALRRVVRVVFDRLDEAD
jgi:hypothetical protein